jgi:hypothetical protein
VIFAVWKCSQELLAAMLLGFENADPKETSKRRVVAERIGRFFPQST